MLREDGRKFNEERKIKITKDVNIYAEGSVLIEVGNTKAICTASVTDKVPSFLRGTGKGWVTAEYSMLPRATNERNEKRRRGRRRQCERAGLYREICCVRRQRRRGAYHSSSGTSGIFPMPSAPSSNRNL